MVLRMSSGFDIRTTTVATLAEALSALGGGSLLVVTGAGVSLASGLATFRGSDPEAVWANDVMEKGTFHYFLRNPLESWRWYLSRFGKLVGAEPNASHRALAALEQWHTGRGGEFLLVTQNVDGLHRAAGSQSLVEVHGRADRVRCAAIGCANGAPRGSLAAAEVDFSGLRTDGDGGEVPTCVACGALLRPHVLWFDERYIDHADYQVDRVLRAAKRARLVLFAGTSFSVGITDMILDRALGRGVPVFNIDPSARTPHRRVGVIAEPAETALPSLVTLLAT